MEEKKEKKAMARKAGRPNRGGEWDIDAAGIMDGAEDEAEAPLPEDLSGGGGEEEGFELRHLDEVVTVDRDKVVELAQKGMDYDRIRAKLDSAREELSELKAWLDSVSGPRGAQEFRDELSAKALAGKEGIGEEEALRRVKAGRAGKAESAAMRRRREAREFVEAKPEVAAKLLLDPGAVQDEVWARVRAGESLLAAYNAYAAKRESEEKTRRIRELEAELAGTRQAKANALRSAGSVAGSGGGESFDPAAAGWNEV